VIPRANDLPEELLGPGIFGELGVSEDKWVPEPRMNEIALSLRQSLVYSGAAPGIGDVAGQR
jgi:hypothetical protein